MKINLFNDINSKAIDNLERDLIEIESNNLQKLVIYCPSLLDKY